ncbi:MAG: hypothetical protein M3Y87_04280, partial [Myxococcota bacterium]|nr:hypothetical protein [Myxococcota bacterium]
MSSLRRRAAPLVLALCSAIVPTAAGVRPERADAQERAVAPELAAALASLDRGEYGTAETALRQLARGST